MTKQYLEQPCIKKLKRPFFVTYIHVISIQSCKLQEKGEDCNRLDCLLIKVTTKKNFVLG